MCGIIALYSQNNNAQILYQGMRYLQHRGQDAAGIATLEEGLSIKRGLGRVEEIFTPNSLSRLHGTLGIGHTRYATSGGTSKHDVQPFYSPNQYGVVLVHSGHLPQASWMQSIKNTTISSVDSNLLLHFLTTLLQENHTATNSKYFFSSLCKAITSIFQQVQGAYSVASLITGQGLVIVRDPHGIRPLAMGERTNPLGKKEYLFASESYFFTELGFQQMRDVQPGEVLLITQKGKLYRQILKNTLKTPCSFEYVYFAHSKSTLNGILVEDTRQRMGKILALRWQQLYPSLRPDFVLPIPNTANTAAFAFAQQLSFTYQEYLQVNHQAGRTFIQTTSAQRLSSLRNKLTIHPEKVLNKIILLFDDSIVRGTTAAFLIKLLRSLGAKAIYLVAACPPVINICTYGINIPTQNELVASKRTKDEIKACLKVDELLYPTLEELIEAVHFINKNKLNLCMKCMK